MTKTLKYEYTPIKNTKWSKKVGIFTNNSVVKLEFYLPVLSVMKIVTCKYHRDESIAV